MPPDDPGRRRPDITRARERLGWQPAVPLETGLQKTIPYFARRLQEENYSLAVSGEQ
jgi:UDP-glucuronate decarboxylase